MDLDPSYSGAYYIRGLAYEKCGNIDRSIDDYSTVLEIDPSHVNAAFARGAWENKRGNYMKAIDDYNMALKLDSERDTQISQRRRLNQNLGMSYVIPNGNGGFLSASKARIKKNNKYFDIGTMQNNSKFEWKLDVISTGGTNSFLEGGDQTPSIFNSTVHSIESTPHGKKADQKQEKFANLLQVEIDEYRKLK